jgi:DNA invertase Pin-like site-specific DNA recombinase
LALLKTRPGLGSLSAYLAATRRPMATTYGSARVATEGRDREPQLAALRAAGCTAMGEEKASGADRTRPELGRLRGQLRRGDTVVVVRIDRLARSLSHPLEMLDRIRTAGAHVRSLSDPIDTASPTGRLVLQVIGAIAEFERNLIAERIRAGLAVARARGRRLGNPALQASLRPCAAWRPASAGRGWRHCCPASIRGCQWCAAFGLAPAGMR